jgi:glycosyltransferase
VLKITVITVSYNSDPTIKDTVKSIANQEYPNIEYIVVDGLSTDNTVAILKSYPDVISKVISEKDSGIYDAMNKGIDLATGDIIGVLNADDFYPHHEVLKKVAAIFEDSSIDCCYGDLVYVDSVDTNHIVRRWHSGEFSQKQFYRGWMPPHPTFFVRRSLYERLGLFRLDMGTSADYELMLRFLLKHSAKVSYIPDVLVKMRTGGASNATLTKRLLANRMDRKAWDVNGLKPYPWTLIFKPLSKLTQYI